MRQALNLTDETHATQDCPRVSIITPTYNRVQLLPRALASVFSQDFTDYELLVVDDGSTDETWDLLIKIGNPRLKCIRFNQNRGIGAARHEAVKAARGQIIAFIDSDDVWCLGKLRYQVEVLERHPSVDILFGNYENINHQTNTKVQGFDQQARGLVRLTIRSLEDDVWQITGGLPEALLEKNFVGTCSMVMMRRSFFDKAGNFNVRLSVEDIELWWRASLRGATFAYTTRSLIERHKDGGSISANFLKYAPRYLEALTCCEETAIAASRPELIQAINKARHGVWVNLIRFHALAGSRWFAVLAFVNSARYAFSFKACQFLSAALAGPRLISLVRKAYRAPR